MKGVNKGVCMYISTLKVTRHLELFHFSSTSKIGVWWRPSGGYKAFTMVKIKDNAKISTNI